MLALLTTAEASPYEPIYLYLDKSSSIDLIPERVVKTKTIDGGSVMYSLGKTDSDRDFSLKSALTESQVLLIDAIRNAYSDFVVAIPSGAFKGKIERIDVTSGLANIAFWVDSKL